MIECRNFCTHGLFQTTLCACSSDPSTAGWNCSTPSRSTGFTPERCSFASSCWCSCNSCSSATTANIQQPIQPMAPQQPHENLFQQAVLEHAASVGSRPQTVQATPVNQPTFQQSRFAVLHTLSSSDSSTASTSSSSSGDSANSVTGTNMPPRVTFQSIGPHPNIRLICK